MPMYKNILIRDNYMDRYIVDEMEVDYEYILSKCNDMVVLDIGANIGAFTRRAYESGAKKVISVEPEPENFSLLKRNGGFNSVFINKAVTMIDDDKVTLYVNSGNNKGLHTIRDNWLVSNRSDHKEIKVKTISINTLLEKYKPDVVKIDIEGGEELIADVISNLPSYVKHVAVEFDTINNSYVSTLKSLTEEFKDGQRNKFFTGSR